jgi:Spy/CpxP family protein refolding chaperone
LLIAAAVLLPSIAILHAASTTTHTNGADQDHDTDHNDQNHHETDHDDNETDDNSIMHVNDDANDNETETD